MDLFDHARQEQIAREAPLAARMRPRTLDEFAGQEHIVGPGRLLRRAIQADQLSSLIFYGPPGTGKTTLARIIANTTQAHFIAIAPSSSWTRCTASIRPSKTHCCPTWRTVRSSSSGLPPRIPTLKSSN